ncbi:hypothetical protein F5884DRAFT_237488 [Xylogone sp. PMI_703]|nr:hypothetical protein F5884DRAFT_237488 [Xylogone sp. PMI_703]
MSSIVQKAKSLVKTSSGSNSNPPRRKRTAPQIFETSYTSVPVDIPESFLSPLPSPESISMTQVDFKNSPLPEYDGLIALVLDGVLSQEECKMLLEFAEKSTGIDVEQENPWKPALVNVGPGTELLDTTYRNSDRIIWDSPELVSRLWQRCLQAKGVRETLERLNQEEQKCVLDRYSESQRWVITGQGMNERMRFLKYTPGQFFRAHCDGPYATPDGSQRSFLTAHLYLNDSAEVLEAESGGKAGPEILRGGATTFHSPNMQRQLDINPKAGRVLIFQHRRLYHSGNDVLAGVKYTMRTDLMYEVEKEEDMSETDVN